MSADTGDLRTSLVDAGVPEDEVAAAAASGTLRLLALERLLLEGPPVYDADEVAARAGMPRELTSRFWRALGFPDVTEGEPAFTEADVEALVVTAGMIERGVLAPEVALQFTRVIASSAARVAETQVEGLTRPAALPVEPERLGAETEALLATPRFFEHMWRRHLAAAARRARLRQAPGEATPVAVGFADLVGFTRMSSTLDEEELAVVVDRFAALAFDRVAAAGGRVVKMIGDEVMFAMDDLRGAAELGLDLVDGYAGDAELPDVRVAMAWGPVLARDGDLFGPTVNLASRIVGIARPASVVVSSEVHEELADDPAFAWHRMRPRYLKGIGRASLWVLRAAPGSLAGPPGADV